MPPVYFGGDAGTICMGSDIGSCTDVITSLGAALKAMHYLHERDLLVTITAQSNLATYKLTDNKPQNLVKVKLSVGRDGLLASCWCGTGVCHRHSNRVAACTVNRKRLAP